MEEVISAKIRGEPHAASRFNWLLLLKFFCGWVATLIVAALTSAAFTAQGIYAPSKPAADDRAEFNHVFNITNIGMAQTLIAAGNVTNPTPAQQQALAWGQFLLSQTASWSTANNESLLNPNIALGIFQNGSWYLGNTTNAGVLTNAYMPEMPLQADFL